MINGVPECECVYQNPANTFPTLHAWRPTPLLHNIDDSDSMRHAATPCPAPQPRTTARRVSVGRCKRRATVQQMIIHDGCVPAKRCMLKRRHHYPAHFCLGALSTANTHATVMPQPHPLSSTDWTRAYAGCCAHKNTQHTLPSLPTTPGTASVCLFGQKGSQRTRNQGIRLKCDEESGKTRQKPAPKTAPYRCEGACSRAVKTAFRHARAHTHTRLIYRRGQGHGKNSITDPDQGR